MARQEFAPIIFRVPGHGTAATTVTRGLAAQAGRRPGGLRAGTVTSSVRVGVSRDAGEVPVKAVPGEDVVVLTLDRGLELTLHPATAQELLLAQAGRTERGATRDEPGVVVPSALYWSDQDLPATTRASVGDLVRGVVIKAFDVLKDVAMGAAADVATGAISRLVDSQVNEGVYRLQPSALPRLKDSEPLANVDPTTDGAPLLVFVHGTFSNTSTGFGKLWEENPAAVRDIFARYRDAVYALDHATLGVSPVANALTLAKALPAGGVLHLVTHSRGGLVAEALATACARPFADGELDGFPEGQADELRTLRAIVEDKGLRVARVVRVACPTRGTLLASRRLDAYLSVFKWTLQLSGVPVAPEVVDFLGAVAQHRLDPAVLPGLAAQSPDSALVQWLHASSEPIPGELRVVAGDVQGDSIASWVKTLLSDGFYWTDNDYVVQTRSMYGGARREAGATFVLDRGGSVAHTAYFAEAREAQRVVDAIVKDEPSDFRPVGPLSWKGVDSSGLRDAQTVTSEAERVARPAVFIVPGFGASRLLDGATVVWPAALSRSAIQKLAWHQRRDDGEGGLRAEGFVGRTFDPLIAALEASHDVVRFAYDWRQPLEVEARRLAAAVDRALDERRSNGQPVRILAHSSGGLLVRTISLERPDVWDRLMSVDGSRVVMAGTPHGGFWLPMQLLSGDETFGGLLAVGVPPFCEADVRATLATMPGLLQLQAGLRDPRRPLASADAWGALAKDDEAAEDARRGWHDHALQKKARTWGRPAEQALTLAASLRDRLDAQARGGLDAYAGRIATVIGTGRATIDGVVAADGSVAYESAAAAGDGRVTLESAVPPAGETWVVDADHSQLPRHTDALPALVELLERGTTEKLPHLSRTRSAPLSAPVVKTPTRPSRTAAAAVPEEEDEILAAAPAASARTATGRTLSVRVVNGDLMFVKQPMMLGHYRAMRLTGTELVMDKLIGGTMSRSLSVGLYPEAPGTNHVFVNTRARGGDTLQVPRPEAVIVAGLGDEGKLTAADLARTVRLAVVAWAQRAAERRDAPAVFDLATTLIGSGGKGMTVSQSAQLIAEAVYQADGLLESAALPRIGELQIIELYLDRATDAWRSLRLQADVDAGRYAVADRITIGSGALRRPLESSYRGADYDFVSVLSHQAGEQRQIVYSLDTKRARTEVSAQATQRPLLSEIIGESSLPFAREEIGRTLFNLLVPTEIEPFLGGSTEIVMELDEGTAGIPWELLDTNSGARQEDVPWSIRAKLIRKLRTPDYRVLVADATADDYVLVIGEPQCDPAKYLRLPGARAEASAVADCLCEEIAADRVRRVISAGEPAVGPNALDVLTALYAEPWRIVHISGHGEPTTKTQAGGVVLSPSGPDHVQTFLSATEVEGMRVVPELVFINCCHVAARERQQLLEEDSPHRHHYDRPAFAAGLAGALIRIGVRCVVAAGWAVEDAAAKAFATTFYRALLRRARFIDAIAEARSAAYALGGNTWAAYQCYGDPEWTFARQTADAQRPTTTNWARRLGGIASPEAVILALETIATDAKFPRDPARADGDRLADLRRGLERLEVMAAPWGHIGRVADAFGSARGDLGDLPEAVAWYDRAAAANDGTASLRAIEQAANLRARIAWERVSGSIAAGASGDELLDRLRGAAAEIEAAIEPLESLSALRATTERESLIASAYKRIALVWGAAGDAAKERAAIDQMRASYVMAEKAGHDQPATDLFYPSVNRIVADVAMSAIDGGSAGLDRAAVGFVRERLRAREDDPDFWSVVGAIELDMFEAIAERRLAKSQIALLDAFSRLGERVQAPKMWRSVYDNATFVLGIYQRSLRRTGGDAASAAEAAAADAVLAVLRRLARASTPAAAAGSGSV